MSSNPNLNLPSRPKVTGGPSRDDNDDTPLDSPTTAGPSNDKNANDSASDAGSGSMATGKGKKKKAKWQKLDMGFNVVATTSASSPRVRFLSQMSRETQAMMAKPYTSSQLNAPKPGESKFSKFMCLPSEIRLMIYDTICEAERFIEMQWDGPLENPSNITHFYYRPTAKARRVPSILHIMAEARLHILSNKYYNLVDFSPLRPRGNIVGNSPPINMLYNPASDIPFFGMNTCMRTLVDFISDMKTKEIRITKIALVCSGRLTNACHNWNQDDPILGPDQHLCDIGQAIAGGCTPLEALHGLDKATSLSDKTVGILGLEKVYSIVPTKLIPMDAGQIYNTVSLRPAICHGLTSGQVQFNKDIEDQIKLVKNGTGLPRCPGELNKWVGNAMPKFEFASFCEEQFCEDKKVHDAMVILESLVWKVAWASGEWLERLENRVTCKIVIPERDFSKAVVREIGFYGLPENVQRAKEAITDRTENWEPRRTGRGPNGGQGGRGRGRGDRGRGH